MLLVSQRTSGPQDKKTSEYPRRKDLFLVSWKHSELTVETEEQFVLKSYHSLSRPLQWAAGMGPSFSASSLAHRMHYCLLTLYVTLESSRACIRAKKEHSASHESLMSKRTSFEATVLHVPSSCLTVSLLTPLRIDSLDFRGESIQSQDCDWSVSESFDRFKRDLMFTEALSYLLCWSSFLSKHVWLTSGAIYILNLVVCHLASSLPSAQ